MTDWSEVFSTLWNFILQVIGFMSKLWEFLTNRITLGFQLEKVNIPVVGGLINWLIDILNGFSVSFVPLYVFGGVTILTLLTMYLIKTFVPLA